MTLLYNSTYHNINNKINIIDNFDDFDNFDNFDDHNKEIIIYDLDDIITNINHINYINYENGTLCIDIDTCIIEEKTIAELFNSNPFLRNKIITSTNKLYFNMTDDLIITRSNLHDFIKKCKNIFKKIIYITKKSSNEISKIKKFIVDNDLSFDNNIISINMLTSININTLFFIDTNNESFNNIIKQNTIKNINKSKLFIISPIQF